jgi:hypothetical protein
MKAPDFLRKGADLLEDRGKQYDQPGGERSMGKTVRAFNAITGRDLTEPEGWLLLQVLKDVRQWQNPDKYHADSAEDCVSYAALKAEALANQHQTADYTDKHDDFGSPLPVEPASEIDDESPRMQAIGQNGEMAEEVYAAIDGLIKLEGGICPVDPSFTVAYVMAAGDSTHYDNAGKLRWLHTGRESDIVAYRIHKES